MAKARKRRAKTTSARKIRANRRNGLKGGRPRKPDADAALRGTPSRGPVESPAQSSPAPVVAPPRRPERPWEREDGSRIFLQPGSPGSLLPSTPNRRREP